MLHGSINYTRKWIICSFFQGRRTNLNRTTRRRKRRCRCRRFCFCFDVIIRGWCGQYLRLWLRRRCQRACACACAFHTDNSHQVIANNHRKKKRRYAQYHPREFGSEWKGWFTVFRIVVFVCLIQTICILILILSISVCRRRWCRRRMGRWPQHGMLFYFSFLKAARVRVSCYCMLCYDVLCCVYYYISVSQYSLMKTTQLGWIERPALIYIVSATVIIGTGVEFSKVKHSFIHSFRYVFFKMNYLRHRWSLIAFRIMLHNVTDIIIFWRTFSIFWFVSSFHVWEATLRAPTLPYRR